MNPFTWINDFYDGAGASIGVDGSQLKMLTCFIISYPLGSVFVRIPKDRPNVKHAFSIAVTLFFLLGMLDLWSGTLHLVASGLFTYFTAANMHGRNMPWIVFAGVMGHLLVSHWIRYQNPSDVVEISGPQMVLTMKLTTYAWNVYDGRQKLEALDESQKETRIPETPPLLAFFGYVFYFPAFLVGPALTFSEYTALITETLYDGAVATPNGSKRVPFGRKRVAYQRLALSLVCMGGFAVYGSTFSHQVMLTEWWMTKSFAYRVFYVQIIGLVQRMKYYGAWCMTEGACIFTGLGFNGFDKSGHPRWDKAANVDILNIEFAPNFKVLLDSWNINTNTWLRNSVYKRLVKPGKKPTGLTTMATFMTSALWHGICPGYYLTFFVGGVISSAAKQVRTYIRPFFLPANFNPKSKILPAPTLIKRAYDIVGTLTCLIILNYIVAPFMLLELAPSIKAWNSLYWYGHIVAIGWLVWGHNLGGYARLGKTLKARAAKAQTSELKAELEKNDTLSAGKPMPSSATSGTVTPSGQDAFTVPPFDAAIKELADGDAFKDALAGMKGPGKKAA